jgi:hypothetical protein
MVYLRVLLAYLASITRVLPASPASTILLQQQSTIEILSPLPYPQT